MNDTLTLEEVVGLARSVTLAVAPLAGMFLLFQLLFLKLPPREVSRILTGTIFAAAGLFLFLMGVGIGFLMRHGSSRDDIDDYVDATVESVEAMLAEEGACVSDEDERMRLS